MLRCTSSESRGKRFHPFKYFLLRSSCPTRFRDLHSFALTKSIRAVNVEEITVKFGSSKSTNMALDVDSVLKHTGQLGPFQIRILVMFLFIFFPITYPTLIMLFVAFEPPWMCAQESLTCLESNSSSAGSEIYSTFSYPFERYLRRCFMNRSDWKFADYNLYEGPHRTIVDEFDLVCDRGALAWLANSMLYIGWIVGSIVLGSVADRFGRKSVLFPSVLGVLVFSFAMSFAKVFWIVPFFRAIIGFCEAGCYLATIVLATELVGPEKRALATTLIWFYFTGALLLLGLKAYFVRNWRTLMILSSAPFIFIVLFWKFVPESVRWLLVKGRKEEARAILENVAKVNKKKLPNDDLLVPVTTASKGVLELFKKWKMAKMTLVIIFMAMVNSMGYYGLSLSSGEFGGSIYLNFVLTSLVEIPANVLVIDNCNRFGRKKTTIAYMIAAGVFIVAVSFIPHGTNNTGFIAGRVTLGTLGKMFVTTSFDAMLVLALEIFPTVARNSGLGMASIAVQVGGALAPFVVQLTRVNAILPFAVMGVCLFIGAVMCCVLPETLGKKTAEVLEDVEKEKDTARELDKQADGQSEMI